MTPQTKRRPPARRLSDVWRHCPNCHAFMRISRIAPVATCRQQLRFSFECDRCALAVTETIDWPAGGEPGPSTK